MARPCSESRPETSIGHDPCPMSRRPEPNCTTRERLIREATALFARQGFDATRTADIERAAGLAPGSGGAFRYFPSKRRLLADGVTELVGRATSFRSVVTEGVAGLDAALDGGDLVHAYRSLGWAVLAFADEVADASTIVLREAGVSRHEVPELADLAHQFARSNYDAVAEVFDVWLRQRGVDTGRFDLPVAVYLAFAPLFHARAVAWLLGESPGGIDDGRLLDIWASTQVSLLRGLLEGRN